MEEEEEDNLADLLPNRDRGILRTFVLRYVIVVDEERGERRMKGNGLC